MNTNQRPVHEIRLGHIKAALWKNTTTKGPRFNVTFTRLYFDNDHWQSSESFGRSDLLMLAKVVDQAHSWICQQPPATKPAATASSKVEPSSP
jgi:hypothetical protein